MHLCENYDNMNHQNRLCRKTKKAGDTAMQIHKASEDYLETMLMLRNSLGYVRSVDVAEHLGVTKPSVTYATKRLRENGYIEMDKDGLITLTDSGMEIAAKMLQRHHTLTNFLVELGVDPVTAEEDACKMEHLLGSETLNMMKKYVDENQKNFKKNS